jgi:hypothetical protein
VNRQIIPKFEPDANLFLTTIRLFGAVY